MNNPTYLQKQYAKLTKKLNKAFATGRFYEYTQYKQQQLLDKFASYTLQMKKLGMVAAVGAAVAMATPASGQIMWDTNPSYQPITLNDSIKGASLTYVDIDGDGDYDIVSDHFQYGPGYNFGTGAYPYNNVNHYYENIGDSAVANFVERTPLFSVANFNRPSFVDIDNDGDLDCFAGVNNILLNNGDKITYFENTGSPTNPVFIERTGANNPLDSVNVHNTSIRYSGDFVDIDGDGDQDYFELIASSISDIKYHYYQNTGTATNPVFLRNNTINPLDTITTNISFNGLLNLGSSLFHDMDGDGDMDLSIRGKGYYENTGTTTSPAFVQRTGMMNPLDNIMTQYNQAIVPSFVDIDGDGDLDLMGGTQLYQYYFKFYENVTITGINSVVLPQLELEVFPNPTTGIINLEESLAGSLEVFNTLGQVVYTEQLEEEQQLSLSHLGNGTYIVKIQTEEGVLQEKVVLQR